MAAKKERSSNLELLRIISMVMIILAHYAGHGGIIDNADTTSGHVLGLFLKTGGKLGVVCFVLISTYFLCEQRFKLRSLIKTVLQTMFYALLILCILLLTGQEVGMGAIVKTIVPLQYSLYWFVTAYAGMYLAQPILKKCAASLTEKNSEVLLITWGVVLTIVPVVVGNPDFIVNTFVMFCYLFFMGHHIKRFGIRYAALKKYALLIGLLSAVLIPLVTFAMEIVLKRVGLFEKASSKIFMLYDLNSPLMILAGTELFLFFEGTKMRTSRFINWFAGGMFGVYLIHDNGYFRKLLWHDLLRIDSVYPKNVLIILGHAILCTLIILTAATLVECIRRPIEALIFRSEALGKLCDHFDRAYADL